MKLTITELKYSLIKCLKILEFKKGGPQTHADIIYRVTYFNGLHI